jgi:hypothetical protein
MALGLILRTLGCLTNPDMLQPGEEKIWLPYLLGQEASLHHGYFMTKQPGTSDDLDGVDVTTAERDSTWFENTKPWCDSSKAVKQRMGVHNLTTYLSGVLSCAIYNQ